MNDYLVYMIILIGYLASVIALYNWYKLKDRLSGGEAFTLAFISTLYVYWQFFAVDLASRATFGRLAFIALLFTIVLRAFERMGRGKYE